MEVKTTGDSAGSQTSMHDHESGGERRIRSVSDIGTVIRTERRRQKVTQAEAAGLCGVSVHFFSNLERGKETSEFAKVLQVLNAMNISLYLMPPGGNE